ncbi:MAG: hypothetical protein JJU30_00960 [Alkalimonas sp.]|nr:hypothetical protein [Alkalimonas sp.]
MELLLSSSLFAVTIISLVLGLSCLLYACTLPTTLTAEQKAETRIEFGVFSAGAFAILAVMLFALCYG